MSGSPRGREAELARLAPVNASGIQNAVYIGRSARTANSSFFALLIFRLYLYSLPFTYAFSYREGLVTLTVWVAIFALLFCIFKFVFGGIYIPDKFPMFLLSLFCLSLVATIIYQNIPNDKTINHLSAYSGSVVLFCIVPMLLVSVADDPLSGRLLLNDLANITRLCSLAVIVQFWMNNFTAYTFEDFIPYPQGIEAQSMFLGQFFRSRGFAAEPGHFSLLLEMLVPLMAYSQRERWRRQRWLLPADIALVFLGFCAIGSPTGFIVLGVAYVFAQAISGSGPRSSTLVLMAFSVGVIVAIYEFFLRDMVGGFSLAEFAWELISGKLESSSANVRADRFALGWTLLGEATPMQLIFGYGPASYFNLNLGDQSIIQLAQLLLVESGVVGTALFSWAFLSLARTARRTLGDARMFFFWSMGALVIHYTFISNYYYPYLWLLFPLRYILRERSEN